MARTVDPELERIKQQVDLVQLVEESGVALKRVDDTARGRCPWHPDENPSLVITISRQLWRCFPCGVGGSCFDWVMKRDGVSFKHAKELLTARVVGYAPAAAAPRKLPSPVSLDADDRQLLAQVVDYYWQTLKREPGAQDYLRRRGLGTALIDVFKIGYANRTLAYRLPPKSRHRDDDVRGRLMGLGILRQESGHEHLSGSLTIPVFDENGDVVELYGRKILDNLRKGTPLHLYLARKGRPERGVWNLHGLEGQEESILCEALIDALTFWSAGFRNVTSAYGADVFPAEHVEAYKRLGVKRVLIAFDRDEAGDRGAEKVAARLEAAGIAPFRVQLPHGMDANEYALKVQPAGKSLGLALQSAVWMGKGPAPARSMVLPVIAAPERTPSSAPAPVTTPVPAAPAAEGEAGTQHLDEDAVVEPLLDKAESLDDAASGKAPEAGPPSAACPEPAEGAVPPAAAASPDVTVRVTPEQVEIDLEDRRYRVRGLGKNTSHELMKVNVTVTRGDAFHVDSLDLYAHRYRQMFQRTAADELGMSEEVVKVDLGRVLRKLEELRDATIKKALEPKDTRVVIPKERKAAAAARLKAPGLIPWILESLDVCGMVGERTNKLVVYLAAVSRLLPWPLGILVQSTSAAGKSTLVDKVLDLMPEESTHRFSALTGQALFYMQKLDLRHTILSIAEEQGASKATYSLKLLQSDGKLRIASTGKDAATGEFDAKVYGMDGPVALCLASTAIDVDDELENRLVKVAVDEGREQTRRIHEMQRQMMTLEGIVIRKRQAKVIELHQDVQRLLRPLDVRIPFALRLTFPDHATRTRRDNMKYLTLIQSIALLHQYQRPVRTVKTDDGQEQRYIDATVEDIAMANELADEVLGRSLSELPPQTQALLEKLDLMATAGCQEKGVSRQVYRLSRRAILDYSGMSLTRVRMHLQRLVDYEYVLVHQGKRGQSFEYELLYEGEGRRRARFVLGLIDVERLRGEAATTAKVAGVEARVAGSGGQVAGSWPGHGRSMAGGVPTPPNGGNGKGDAGSSDSRLERDENAAPRVKPNGDGHSRTRAAAPPCP